MTTIKDAIYLLDLEPDDMVHVCAEHYDHINDKLVTIKELKAMCDIQKTEVKHVYRSHWRFEAYPEEVYEFVVPSLFEKRKE